MNNPNWRYGVVANIVEYHIGENRKSYLGTKTFTAGTKVYLGGKDWNAINVSIGVIGLNRFGKITLEWIPVDYLENIRTKRIYKPHILDIINYQETVEGWEWWGQTSSDKKETEEFVKNWKTILTKKAIKD